MMGIRSRLDGTSLLQERGQLALLCLQIRVPTNVLATDEDVGDGALARHLGESVLNGTAIVYKNRTCQSKDQRHSIQGPSDSPT